jgi:xanthine dehydrogenase YagR molybdenum-binding subunit
VAKIVKTQIEIEGRWHEEEVIVEQEDLQAWDSDAVLNLVGKPLPRVDGFERVTGKARYTYDIQRPGMLTGKILRCPYAHARIKSIDTSKAESLRGVHCVIDSRTAPEIPWQGGGLLFNTTLRFEGEEVAAVAAENEYIARDALAMIEVEYEELDFVLDPEEALSDKAPRLFPEGNLVGEPSRYERGDLEAGFSEADAIVEERYSSAAALHNSLETHGSVAHWEAGTLTVWDSTQHIFGIRTGLSQALGLALNRIRVIKHYIGGGFGSKNRTGKYTVLAALLARKTGRPVKIMLSREEENLAAGNRPATVMYVKLGARRDGELTALEFRSYGGIGGYGTGGFSVGGPARELYQCKNVRTEEVAVHTNTGPSCAFRGPGYVEGSFALESAMDQMARKLDMDPLALRLKNYAEQNQVRNLPYSVKDLRTSYEQGAERFGWKDRAGGGSEQGGQNRAKKRGKLRGVGMASQIWGGGGKPPSYALMRVNADGTFDILTGTQDLGTGTRTVMTQIAADELGVSMDRIRITLGDTLACPYSPLSAGSLTVPSVGPPVRMAAKKAKEQLLDIASFMLDKPVADLEMADNEIFSRTESTKRTSVDEVAAKVGNYMIIGRGVRGPNPEKVSVNTFGAHFAEVEVDSQTGKVTVLRVVAAHGFGRVLNPLTLSSQVEGGVIQGLGFGLLEGRVMDGRTGKMTNPNLTDYKMPTVMETPKIEMLASDAVDSQATSIGSKGAGEPPIIPTAAAIANAVFDAIGIRVRDLPITPDRILEALKQTAAPQREERR